jgi:Flp pilus assembly protein TadG
MLLTEDKRVMANDRAESTRDGRRGSVLLLTVFGLSVVLGMVGFALDIGRMYAVKQEAQAAADAAAQAGIMDFYNGTNTGTNAFGTAQIDCKASSVAPCVYAKNNRFDPAADHSSTVILDFCNSSGACTSASCSAGGAGLSTSDAVNVICASVSRVVNTTFLQVIGASASTVTARATAAILSGSVGVPLGILHPTLSNALQVGGSIKITGGIQRSLQVNSNNSTAFSTGTIDLSHAGPAGTGGDFGVVGGPATKPAGVSLGTTGAYITKVSVVQDPLASVPAPPSPGFAGSSVNLGSPAVATNGCPANPPKNCTLYSPGTYSTGLGIDSKNEVSVFRPGIYYIGSGKSFIGDANGSVVMATGCTDGATNTCAGQATTAGTNTGWTGNVLFYFTGGGQLNIGSNFGSACFDSVVNPTGTVRCSLIGAPAGSAYEGILFFNERTATGAPFVFASFGGGGGLSMTGSIYATNSSKAGYPDTGYQNIIFKGGSGSATNVIGEIVTDTLQVNNNTNITMTLSSQSLPKVRQVALIK